MADLSEAYAALQKADASGNHEDAKKIADYIRSSQVQQSEKPQLAPNTGNNEPSVGERAQKTFGTVARDIGASTTIGGLAGAVAPELVQGAGALVGAAGAAFPPIAPVAEPTAAALMTTGTAMRAARTASVVTGALSGLVSESAGQIAEAAGASDKNANIARFGAGFLSPGAQAVSGFVAKPVKTAWTLVNKLVGGAETDVPAAVRTARESLAAMKDSGKPQLVLHDALQQGVEADRAAADTAAKSMIADAHARAARIAQTDEAAAQRVIDDARMRGDTLKRDAATRADALNKAASGRLETASRVRQLADGELGKVGQQREISDIGNEIRSKVTAEQQQAVAARAQQYQAKMAERDAVVADKEAKGLFVDTTPEMKALKSEISQKLLLTKAGRDAAQGKAAVTEQGVSNAYQRVYDAVSNKRVQTGVTPEGLPQFQTFKTSFEALDHVRRKLGDVAFGKEAEGYSGLGQAIAKDLYSKISKIQESYAGPVQRELQSGYSEATGDLAKFGTVQGKKLTAVDRMNPESFLKDPASVPASYFRSQQGVKDLVELTGDKALVAKTAADYTAHSLEGKSSEQAAAWLKGQSDWMREIPGLRAKANDYVAGLSRIERVEGKLQGSAKGFAGEASGLRPEAAKTAESMSADARKEASSRVGSRVEERQNIVSDAAKVAEESRKATVAKAESVVKAGFPAESVRGLLMKGSPEDLRTATRYLAGSPGGKLALEGSVRQVLRDLPENRLQQTWNERMAPMLKESQLLSPAAMAKLEGDVQKVLSAYSGPAKRSAVQALVSAALGSVGGSLGAGLVDKIVSKS